MKGNLHYLLRWHVKGTYLNSASLSYSYYVIIVALVGARIGLHLEAYTRFGIESLWYSILPSPRSVSSHPRTSESMSRSLMLKSIDTLSNYPVFSTTNNYIGSFVLYSNNKSFCKCITKMGTWLPEHITSLIENILQMKRKGGSSGHVVGPADIATQHTAIIQRLKIFTENSVEHTKIAIIK